MASDRLLIVDDEPLVADLVRRVALGCEYDARATTRPGQFLEQLEAWAPTHIALDLQMPEMDGVELLRQLAARKCQARVIVMTGAAGKVLEAARRLAAEHGLNVAGSLHKPFRAAELRALLEQARSAPRQVTSAELSRALDAGELFLEYQPKIDLREGRLAGLEALVRWRRAGGGVLSPDAFVPIAEADGLAGRLGAYVIERVLTDLSAWPPLPHGGNVAVNLSAAELDDFALADRLAERCAAAGIEPDRIMFEVAESAAVRDALKHIDVLTRLRLKGFDLALDDFGAGHSSLVQLQRLPVSELKIDKSFVLECGSSRDARAIVRAMIDLARSLGLACTAKGVESAATLDLLASFGCQFVQGFHISQPLAAEAVPEWVARGSPVRGVRVRREGPPRHVAPTVWTKAYDGTEEVRAQLMDALTRAVNPLWDLGRNSLVGWRPNGAAINVLMAPYGRLIDHFPRFRRLLQGRRLMGEGTFEEARRIVGVEAVRIPLPFEVADRDGAVPTEDIEQALRRYGITETLHRGVALFDIVGFSKEPPMFQVAQLNSLETSLNSAHKVMREIGVPIDLARTTTGDGFYVWNRQKGFAADVSTYLLTLVALADNAIARLEAPDRRTPEVRVCYSVGSHYSYYQVEGLDPRGHDYIVGDVTIALARMGAKCLPGQILIGEFQRPRSERPETIGVLEFVAQAARELENLRGLELRGRRVEDLRCYLTGREDAAGGFSLSRFLIRDKHGRQHPTFNQKFNVYLGADDASRRPAPLFLGLPRDALDRFDAERAEVDWRALRGDRATH